MRGAATTAAVLVGGLLAVAAGCATTPEAEGRDVERVADWLSGVFSSAEQAARDPDDEFLPIRLVTVPVWSDRDDGPWLYVEQAAESALDRPYRQRVYHLRRAGDAVISDVYTLPAPEDAVGCWTRPEPLGATTPAELDLREGCSITLVAVGDDAYQGATTGRACPSALFGASYATSQVTLEPDLLTSWDRGFDADGVQVWGAETGPYRFVRTHATASDL